MADPYPARWWHRLEDGRIQCDLCPRDCRLQEGQRGFCFVRQRAGDRMVLTTYGRSSGFCVDPIEKKPLNHFLPGSSVLSFGTAGCNLGCRFCQNWDISKSREIDRLADEATPQAIAAEARALGCKSVAFTYNDPVIFAEYAMDVADACREQQIRSVAVTAGYIRDEPRRAFYEKMDAANVDLKAFTEDFYQKLTFSHLQPILETLEYLHRQTKVWLEITTLLIPGHNDSDEEICALSAWVMDRLGPDVPLHFTAFHPDFKMLQVPPTPAS
ncbi:MAG TPA: AmmeMemoRadiSam system radical SAM enzyme, partial [Myxococcaceae bacterium]|nr:AmmeMemoRadiSam system radical SAM enzyme [Myxococcaceae bacterium]